MAEPSVTARPGLAMNPDRTLSWDWYPGRVPDNVRLDPEAYLETTYSFHLCRSRQEEAVRIERGASVYLGTMFDLGPRARVGIGAFSLVNGARIICDEAIQIGSHCLISWNTVFMDTYRLPRDWPARREALERISRREPRGAGLETAILPGTKTGDGARPIQIGRKVWIGFDVCVLPGVTIGDGSIVGARSVVDRDVPPYTVAAGNPVRFTRQLNPPSVDAPESNPSS
jgi:acetyltransferase-like isoleucine patch superfamily enzyme